MLPESGANALTAPRPIHAEAKKIAPRLEAGGLVIDLAVAERRILLIGRDDTHLLVMRVVPPAVLRLEIVDG